MSIKSVIFKLFETPRPKLIKDSWNWIKYGCPDCGDKEYYSGPEGGMNTNICCANPLCRSAFNVILGGGFAVNSDEWYTDRITNSHFRSVFTECPEESEAYERVQITKNLTKETDEIIGNLVNGKN